MHAPSVTGPLNRAAVRISAASTGTSCWTLFDVEQGQRPSSARISASCSPTRGTAPTDPASWPVLRERFAAVLAGRTRAEWWAVFAGTDACVAPVWSLSEAAADPHNRARGVYTEVDGVVQPAVAPRFSATPGSVGSVPRVGEHDAEVRAELGLG